MKTVTKGNKRTVKKNSPRKPAVQSRTSSRTRSTGRVSAKSSAPKKLVAKDEYSHPDELKKLFHSILKDTLNAEKQLVKALPKMEKAATSKQLASAFKKHLSETEKQVKRLEKVFSICDLKIAGKKCEAMEGLIKEGKEAIDETAKGSLIRDVALIIAAQKVEHYEMAAYGSLRAIAEVCGFDKAAELLQQTLDEEGETDKKLTAIAASLNPKASDKTIKKSSKTAKEYEPQSISTNEVVENAVYMEEDDVQDEEEEEGDYDLDDDEEEKEDTNTSTDGLGRSL